MLTEWPLFGFLLPPLMLPALAALLPYFLITRMMSKLRLYHWFWHPGLLDITVYILCFYGMLWSTDFFLLTEPLRRG